MILSGPVFELGNVKSSKILAAFFASDFTLLGIGVFTILMKDQVLFCFIS
jgi:hypothetical protein